MGLEWPGWQEGESQEWVEKKRFDSSLGAATAVDFQNFMSVYNPGGLCKFIVKGSFTPQQTAELFNKAMGWDWDGQKVLDTHLWMVINVELWYRTFMERSLQSEQQYSQMPA